MAEILIELVTNVFVMMGIYWLIDAVWQLSDKGTPATPTLLVSWVLMTALSFARVLFI